MGIILTDEQLKILKRFVDDASTRNQADRTLAGLNEILGVASRVEVNYQPPAPIVQSGASFPLVITVMDDIAQDILNKLRAAGIKRRVTLDQDDKEVVISIDCENDEERCECRYLAGMVLFMRYGAAVDSIISQALSDTSDGLRPLSDSPDEMSPIGTALLRRFESLTYPNRLDIIEYAKANAKAGVDVELDAHPDMWEGEDGTWVSAKIFVPREEKEP